MSISISEKRFLLEKSGRDERLVLIVDSTKEQITLIDYTNSSPELYEWRFKDDRPPMDSNLFPDSLDFKVLAETKQLKSIRCQRIELFKNGNTVGFGWVALNVKLPVLSFNTIRLFDLGQLIEFELTDVDGVLDCELIEYTENVVFPFNYFVFDRRTLKGCYSKD